jgi:group I intron endonuclease
MIGIYCIENVANSKKYIGYSTRIEVRWRNHAYYLRKNCHDNDHLQKAYNKYGLDNFIYYIIEECEESLLFEKEKYYIAFYKTRNPEYGYNLTEGGKGSLHPREETLEKLRNKHVSDETRRKQSESTKGIPKSEEWKSKMRGRKMSEENKRKLIEMSKNRIQTEEEKENRSLQHISKKRDVYKNPTSKYIGVCFRKNAWYANIRYNRKQIYIGRFDTEVEAAIAYNEAYFKYYPEGKGYNIISNEDMENSIIIKKQICDERIKNKTSKYKGVHYSKECNKFIVMVYIDKKNINMGRFEYEVEAALAYNEIVSDAFGSKAKLNDIPKEEIINLWGFDIFKEE